MEAEGTVAGGALGGPTAHGLLLLLPALGSSWADEGHRAVLVWAVHTLGRIHAVLHTQLHVHLQQEVQSAQ